LDVRVLDDRFRDDRRRGVRMKTWQAVLGGVATTALLAACGGGGSDDASGESGSSFAEESPQAILDAAEKDMKALETVRLDGTMNQGGEELTFEMAVSTSGDCEGSIGVQGGKAEILSVDGQSWMRPDEAFWKASAGESAAMITGLVGDKWVVLSGDDGDFAELCDLDELLSDMGDDEDAADPTTEGTEELDGTEAVKVASETDEGDPVTVWVAVDEPHHLLKMEVTEGEEPGVITFSDFDEELDVQAPADEETIDLDKLGS
jgi:hypothetical protein